MVVGLEHIVQPRIEPRDIVVVAILRCCVAVRSTWSGIGPGFMTNVELDEIAEHSCEPCITLERRRDVDTYDGLMSMALYTLRNGSVN